MHLSAVIVSLSYITSGRIDADDGAVVEDAVQLAVGSSMDADESIGSLGVVDVGGRDKRGCVDEGEQ